MTAQLVLVHGRSQEGRDPRTLKAEWIDALRRGLDAGGLSMPVAEDRVLFPYYGDALRDLVRTPADAEAVARVVVRGEGVDAAEQAFLEAVLREAVEVRGVTPAQIEAEYDVVDAVERAPQNWRWVRAVLRALDTLPAAGGPSLAIATRDVYLYLRNIGFRDRIEQGVRQAFGTDGPMVVVGHSLGSVVAYNLLRRDGATAGWRVPLYVTVGSPLGVGAVRRNLAPITFPECVGRWFNASDAADVVALRPLSGDHFPTARDIENKLDVVNGTPNRHGISGYLSDPVIARRIHDALVGL